MNKYTILLFGILIAFLSCDGRDRVKKSNVEVLVENKLLDSFSEKVKYFPETYAETTTDTILSNGFRVKIKNYTDMSNSVIQTFEVDSIKNKYYYREVVSEVTVFNKEKQIFNQTIDDKFLSIMLTNYVTNQLYVDEQKSLDTNKLHLVASLCIPKTINCPIYSIIIDENGKYEVVKT